VLVRPSGLIHVQWSECRKAVAAASHNHM